MNTHEVLANRTNELLGVERIERSLVHPNDDVNRNRSSNDVFLSAMHVAAAVAMLKHSLTYIEHSIQHLYELALGGSTVGTGLNTHLEYEGRVAKAVTVLTGHRFISVPNKFESLSTCDALVDAYGTLKDLVISMMKIANDVRWLVSDPPAGLMN